MDENKPKNIFEEAGRAKKKVSSKTLETSPSEKKMESQTQPVSFSSGQLLDLHRDPEINVMLNKMYRMQEDIHNRLEQIYNNSGLSTSQIKNFLNNPGNFPPEIWQRIQGQRDIFEKKIVEVLQIYAKKPKKEHISGSKERKAKTLGARRNWIPM